MKFVSKGVAGFLLAGALCIGQAQSVQACDQTPDCYAKTEISVCGYVRETTAYRHLVEAPNGYQSYCTVKFVSGPHTIKCGGCGAVLRTETRTCSEIHSDQHCFSKNNMCKY